MLILISVPSLVSLNLPSKLFPNKLGHFTGMVCVLDVWEKKKITPFPKETKLCMGKVRVIKSLGTLSGFL